MHFPRVLRDKRGDISSPIIVILITVAALAVAGMTVAWMTSTGVSSVTTGALVIIGTPAISSNNLMITVKNLGPSQAMIQNASIAINNTTYFAGNIAPSTINSGESRVVLITLIGSPSPQSGQIYYGSLMTNHGTLAFTAIAQ